MEQKPSVGRIVHFGHPVYDKDRTDSPVFAEPWAAIITRVHADSDVEKGDVCDLTVFAPYGAEGEKTLLRHVRYGDEGSEYAGHEFTSDTKRTRAKYSEKLAPNCWSWPPRV